MSLPEFGGMDTGFNYYHGADPSEYDLVVSNSEGGLPRLLELGARRAEAVFWGADAEFFAPREVEKVHDVFFYGYGDKFRREWMAALVGEPSRAAPELEFALGGRDFQGDTGPRLDDGRRPVQHLRARDLAGPDQPQHHAPLARDGRRLLDVPAVRARGERRRDRLEPARRDRALVRARQGAARRRERRRGARRLPQLLADPAQAEAMGAAPASASSTSTPTPTERGSCSSSSALGTPAAARV